MDYNHKSSESGIRVVQAFAALIPYYTNASVFPSWKFV